MATLLDAGAEAGRRLAWRPAVDVYRSGSDWLVKCDLAGVRPEDLHVAASGSRLLIQGVRRDWTICEGRQSYSMEIAYNRFERQVDLPCDVENCDLRTDYRDGMLLIHVHPHRG